MYDLVSPMTYVKGLSSRVAQLADNCTISYGSHLKKPFRYFFEKYSPVAILSKQHLTVRLKHVNFSSKTVFLSSLKQNIFCLF